MNFLSVDTVSAQLHCPMDYFISWRHANSTHLPYSSFASNFEFLVSLFTSYDPKSHKISELYCFQILPSIKVNGGIAPCLSSPRVFRPWKVYNVSAKKPQRSYVWLHSRLIQSLKENWLALPKTDMRNLANFHQSTLKPLNWDLNGILLSKV